MMSDSTTPDQLRARLSRIEGQIRGIAKMLETDRACEDVVTQLMAIRSGIDNVGALVLDTHLADCLSADEHGDQVEALREAMKLWWRFAPASGGLRAPTDAIDEPAQAAPASGTSGG